MAKDKVKAGAEKAAAPEESTGIVAKVKEFAEFFEESKGEVKKVVWPSRKETVVTCSAVLILVVVMSLFLGIVDLGLSKIIALILS